MIQQVKALNLPDTVFDQSAILPWNLELKISQARNAQQQRATSAASQSSLVQNADFDSSADATFNRPGHCPFE